MYVHQSHGFESSQNPDFVFKQKISLYGSLCKELAIVNYLTNASLCKDFTKSIQAEFEMSLMGELKFFIGIQIDQHS